MVSQRDSSQEMSFTGVHWKPAATQHRARCDSWDAGLRVTVCTSTRSDAKLRDDGPGMTDGDPQDVSRRVTHHGRRRACPFNSHEIAHPDSIEAKGGLRGGRETEEK